MARLWRTRVTAPKVLVRGRRWATSRRYSKLCRLAATGYVSGSSTQPTTSSADAWISTDWPLPCDSTSSPVTTTAQPVVRWRTSLS